jgi:hypothetical protein
MLAALVIGVQARANIDISALDTGAGMYSVNTLANVPQVDPNWTVSHLSGGPPPGIVTGSAYLVPNDIGFPFGYWTPNNAKSSWITYSTPTQVGGDNSGSTFQYQVQFIAASTGQASVRWLSDNESTLSLNGTVVGTLAANPPGGGASFNTWGTTSLSLTAGTLYTVDVDVYNEPQGYGNPTGARVEFSGASVVPEPTTMIAGALLLLPFGPSTLRFVRRNRMAL